MSSAATTIFLLALIDSWKGRFLGDEDEDDKTVVVVLFVVGEGKP